MTPDQIPTFPAADERRHLARNVVVGMSTLSVAVLALGYHTSLDSAAATAGGETVAAAPAASSAAASGTGRRSSSSSSGSSAGAGSSSGSTSASSSGSSAGTSSGSSAGTSSAESGTLKDGSYTGKAVGTRFGNVQVQITVSGGKITAAKALQYPNSSGHDRQINSRAIPVYEQSAVAAQSAQIDSVSGATVTWTGYTGSLQSAIDQARA